MYRKADLTKRNIIDHLSRSIVFFASASHAPSIEIMQSGNPTYSTVIDSRILNKRVKFNYCQWEFRFYLLIIWMGWYVKEMSQKKKKEPELFNSNSFRGKWNESKMKLFGVESSSCNCSMRKVERWKHNSKLNFISIHSN
jgi:hypothetical protein